MTAPAPISTRNTCFLDPQGRQVILHGANLVDKDPRTGYLGRVGAQDFAAMRRWGFNVVRLGVIWDGLEPEPGVFDPAYLDGLARLADLAGQQGLWVFLDMHQDLYSALYSDGAPAWATLADGLPHLAGEGVWSDAYFTSPAVQRALDNFWGNALAPDGVGLQDHYARAWGALARRFAGHPAVIGYDLLNEPNPGSPSQEALARLFGSGAEILRGAGDGPTPEELARRWLEPGGREELLARLDDGERFGRLVDAAEPVYAAFERQALMPLYRRAAAAIRQVDPRGILFLEASMGSNMGVRSAIEPLVGPDGQADPAQAYSPHGYDLLVDTAGLAGSSARRVELIFARHGETSARLGLPMLVGEWGAFDGLPGTAEAAWTVSHLFERLRCSDTYWLYEAGLESLPPFRAISRPYPERVAGRLESYRAEPASGSFECAWAEDGETRAPSRFYFPEWAGWPGGRLRLEPPGSPFTLEAIPGGGAWLSALPLGRPARRSLRVEGRTYQCSQ